MATELTEAQCREAMRAGEFGVDVRSIAARVAVVLTQGWCPQWTMMRGWLDRVAAEAGAAAFTLEYDRLPFFAEFLAFKEDSLGNRSIPYVRWYRDGVLVAQGNYVSPDVFVRNFERNVVGRTTA